MDWKRLTWLDWFLGIPLAAGLYVYGIHCIVMQEGVLFFPSHRTEFGSTNDGLNVYGTAAVRAGISYLIWGTLCHVSGIWKAYRKLDRESWGKIVMGLFATATACVLWAMFSM